VTSKVNATGAFELNDGCIQNVHGGDFLGLGAMIMRRLILALLFVGLFGMGAELLLLQHTGSVWELIPLVLMGLALVILTWHAITKRPASVRAVQGIMGLFLIAGAADIALHYQSSLEFKLETNPSLSGWALFWAVVSAKTPPALAPSTMIQLGLLGLVYTYQHPASHAQIKNQGEKNE
jgi:hypothetical protein